jgi:hypothetical protein
MPSPDAEIRSNHAIVQEKSRHPYRPISFTDLTLYRLTKNYLYLSQFLPSFLRSFDTLEEVYPALRLPNTFVRALSYPSYFITNVSADNV